MPATATRLVIAGLMTFVFAACQRGGMSYPLKAGEKTPAASAKMKVTTTQDRSQKVSLKAEHLPHPSSLGANLSTYVVWVDPPDRAPIPVSDMRLSKKQDGKVEFVTPYRDFKVIITAESTPSPARPSGVVVLQGNVAGG